MPSSRTPNPRRSSSADTGLQVMRLETELEEARRAQQVAEADASDARSRLSKLNQELMRTQNSAMAAESHAKQEIQTLQDEVEEQRYAIEGLEQELAAREQETEELKAQLAQPQVVVQPPEADLLDFDMSFADDSRPSTSHVRRSVASRARLSTLRPRVRISRTAQPIDADGSIVGYSRIHVHSRSYFRRDAHQWVIHPRRPFPILQSHHQHRRPN